MSDPYLNIFQTIIGRLNHEDGSAHYYQQLEFSIFWPLSELFFCSSISLGYRTHFNSNISIKKNLYRFEFQQGGETSSCGLPKFFISINLILCFIVSVVSILPKVQEALPNSGLLQSAVVTLYTIYLTWSAVANNPNRECNPGFMSIIDGTKENKV